MVVGLMPYFLSPIGTSCHFAYAADAPLLSLSRHFPRFSGNIYPFHRGHLPVSSGESTPGRVEVYGVYVSCFFGGIAAVATLLRNDIDSLAGYFADAQYDVLFYFTSFCQCRASKLACKGLRTKIFIRRRHFVKMQNDSFKCVSIMRRITEVKNPTEELTGINFIA